MLKLRQQGNKVTMTTLNNHFLSCVVGKCKWKKHVVLKKVPLFATVTDEAFALLVLKKLGCMVTGRPKGILHEE